MSSTMIALLAAGKAERFGGGKLDAPLRGRPLGAWALGAALDVAQASSAAVVVVTPPVAPEFAKGCTILANADAALGMGSSIRIAACAARQAGAERLLIMLADMPFVSAKTLHALVSACGEGAAACAYPDGAFGPPACFNAALYPLLEDLPPEKGAQSLLRHVIELALVTPPAQELTDIDTRKDLARLG